MGRHVAAVFGRPVAGTSTRLSIVQLHAHRDFLVGWVGHVNGHCSIFSPIPSLGPGTQFNRRTLRIAEFHLKRLLPVRDIFRRQRSLAVRHFKLAKIILRVKGGNRGYSGLRWLIPGELIPIPARDIEKREKKQ